MARVRSIEQGSQTVRAHPTEVDCFYQTVSTPRGLLLHLSTFGSDQRASEAKSSQSLQLDETIARRLVEALREAFPHI